MAHHALHIRLPLRELEAKLKAVASVNTGAPFVRNFEDSTREKRIKWRSAYANVADELEENVTSALAAGVEGKLIENAAARLDVLRGVITSMDTIIEER